ncbi:MAG: RusA family crossover junction endodeoxyribonuclease [Patescibacteria group bacterium]|nr:RusA family crossover junction endodeoxyribonuclease [Patescibacteria group bacterium]
MKYTISLLGAPTDNRRHIVRRHTNRMIDSSQYRSWKYGAVLQLQSQKRGPVLVPTFESQLAYRVKIYMASKRTDQMNYIKGLQDVLKHSGIVEDDKWIFPILEPCSIDKVNPRIEITI